MNIGDILLALGIDGSHLEQDVTSEAQKAGDAGAKTLSQRMAAGLKGNGAKVLAGAFSAAAAAATKGALEMEDAVARIRSETGLSQEQAERIAKTSNQIAGDQQQSLTAVTDVAIAIKKNLGATGDQLDDLTNKTVKYARVTKQDGVGAVKAMDDIVDAFGLSLDQVGQVQDQLIVSNQKYGGSIEENQAALAKMAPQLKALNLDYNDGIELLNLFAASGLDAADGQKALNAAITKLPPGETLDEFIKRLSQVQDDGERARLAIEVFGAKSGAKLANAIKPGIDSLDRFGVSAEEAAGATDQAVDALDSSLGGKLRKVLSQAKAALRGFGADFGPGLTAAASLASLAGALGLKVPVGPLKAVGVKIVSAIGAGIVGNAGAGIMADSVAESVSGAAKSGKLSSASQGLGKFLGSGLGKALSVAFAAVAIAEVIDTYVRITDGLKEQTAQINTEVSEATRKQTDAELAQTKAVIEQGLKDINGVWDAGLFTTDTRKGLEANLAEVNTELERRAAGMGPAVASGIEEGAPAATTAAVNLGQAVASKLGDSDAEAKKAGIEVSQSFAQGILKDQSQVDTALELLRNQVKNELTPAQEIAKNVGILTGKELAKALHDRRPGVRAAAAAVRETAEERLAQLIAGGGKVGKKAGDALKAGLHSKNATVRAEAQRVQELVNQKLNATIPKAGAAGQKAGANFGRNFRSSIGKSFVVYVDVRTRGKTNDRGKAAGGPVWGGTPYLVNERTPRSEIFVPSTGGHILTHGDAVRALQGAAGGGGTTYNIPLNVQGALPVTTTRDVIGEIRRVGELGALLPPRLSPQYPRRKAARTV